MVNSICPNKILDRQRYPPNRALPGANPNIIRLLSRYQISSEKSKKKFFSQGKHPPPSSKKHLKLERGDKDDLAYPTMVVLARLTDLVLLSQEFNFYGDIIINFDVIWSLKR